MVGKFKKAFLHRPIKILVFLTINHLQAEPRERRIFLHVIPVRIIVPWIYYKNIHHAQKVVARRCSVEKVFLKILQNSQESTMHLLNFIFCESY